jgi:hypothetical protein
VITTGANIGWQTLIDAAAAAGYRVERCEQRGWLVITPATPRQPSQKLASYRDERAAWRGAAFLAARKRRAKGDGQ